jgi:hypothetical protein
VKELVSHPYKTTGKIIVLFIERRRKTKDSEQNGKEYYTKLICS